MHVETFLKVLKFLQPALNTKRTNPSVDGVCIEQPGPESIDCPDGGLICTATDGHIFSSIGIGPGLLVDNDSFPTDRPEKIKLPNPHVVIAYESIKILLPLLNSYGKDSYADITLDVAESKFIIGGQTKQEIAVKFSELPYPDYLRFSSQAAYKKYDSGLKQVPADDKERGVYVAHHLMEKVVQSMKAVVTSKEFGLLIEHWTLTASISEQTRPPHRITCPEKVKIYFGLYNPYIMLSRRERTGADFTPEQVMGQ